MEKKVNVHIEDAILWDMVVGLTKEYSNDYDLGDQVRQLVDKGMIIQSPKL